MSAYRQVTFTNKNDPHKPTLTQVHLAFLRTYTRISMLTRLIIIKVLKYLQPLHKTHNIIVLKEYILTRVPVPTTTSCFIQTKSSTTHYEYSNCTCVIIPIIQPRLVLSNAHHTLSIWENHPDENYSVQNSFNNICRYKNVLSAM